jgi:hypothetical protein
MYPARVAGQYAGRAFNTTFSQNGKAVLDLYAFDERSGHVRAYFAASEGLTGEAWLTGSVARDGTLTLSGSLAEFRMTVHGRIGPQGTINADYSLESESPQKGTFEVAYKDPIPETLHVRSDQEVSLADLIGEWEVGGGMPGSVNPVTGETSGISFVEGRKLEILPDGSFKHILSHRHCEGSGLGRCCTEDATLEEGPVTRRGRQLIFNINGGGTISRNSCRPAAVREGKVKPHQQILSWDLKTGRKTLCLQNGSADAACYIKQS